MSRKKCGGTTSAARPGTGKGKNTATDAAATISACRLTDQVGHAAYFRKSTAVDAQPSTGRADRMKMFPTSACPGKKDGLTGRKRTACAGLHGEKNVNTRRILSVKSKNMLL